MPIMVAETHGAGGDAPGFTSIPVLDLSLIHSPSKKPIFLANLREALVVVGFFYLKGTTRWVPAEVQEDFVQKATTLCNAPLETKLEMDMMNSKHFLGYSRMGCERTARRVDHREMFDFLTPQRAPGPDEPIWHNVQGPNQWPDERAVPGFRRAIEAYLSATSKLGQVMTSLVAEALDLEPAAMAKFFGNPPRNKLSLLKYPVPPSPPSANGHGERSGNGHSDALDGLSQGVGPHKDGGFLTYLLQATPHAGLEAQNKAGAWVPVPPLPETLVVNVGRSLESMTGGVCTATTHRVSLRSGHFFDAGGRSLGPRFSFPTFQTLKPDLSNKELLSLKMPAHIADLVKDEQVKSDAEAYFAKYHLESPGLGIFTARLTSHPEVGRRWYPELAARALQGQKASTG
ncbi:2OG-Fe(II) oxygenase superfamily protein [Hirsutella rhossiliensis]|uniref:2OG-Fe(II) oxygenase superfamily domain-containing protein n=1 Tax=Hirsutella rhossiliensis TaxID=111463 RepID=A0A9P8MQJ8_9HYPO|nr:2OG-Fe(II) oxygenase superfamily domain-containing protein [Hirsutella rhossiliensis]KAH0959612.1 2OG-Fe(II) oxygenase superfamily domain-containing protein [Hirsutella rhossiliensis]